MSARKVVNYSLGVLKNVKPSDPFHPSKAPSKLPEEYQKFFREWRWQKPAPVHFIPEAGNWKRNPETGEVKPIQNVPIPMKFTPEMDKMLLGGEGIIKGFEKRHPLRRRVPKFWVPVLRRSVVHSEILGTYMPVIVTERVIKLIHEHHGFDYYLLNTPACDLKTDLALKIKRKMLLVLAKGDCYPDDAKKRNETLKKYAQFIIPMEEAEWYGLTLKEAMIKYHLSQQKEVKPLKLQYREQLLQQLNESEPEELSLIGESKSSWLTKINPFTTKETANKE